MSARDEAADSPRAHDRGGFYRRYYEPIASNSLHGLAVIDVLDCVVLFANARFLANHGRLGGTEAPISCHELHGRSESCSRGSPGCVAAAAVGVAELRRSERRGGGDGLPARTTEIIAISLSSRADIDADREFLVIEKEPIQTLESSSEEYEHLAAIARHSADAIIGLDRGWHIRSWNQGAEEVFGYSAEETLGREFALLVPTEAARRDFENEMREFERRGILKNSQSRRIAKDGRTVIVNSTSSLLRDARGNPIGISVICRDVTMEVLLKELIDHQVRAMSVVHEIGELLHSTRSAEEILQLILLGVTAGQGLGFNRAFLLMVEEDKAGRRRLRGRTAIGPSDGEEAARIWSTLSEQRLKLPQLYRVYQEQSADHDVTVSRIVGRINVSLDEKDHVLIRALATGEALNIMQGKVVGDGTTVDPVLCEILLSDTFAVVPLRTHDQSLGVLVVDNRITGIGISDADLQMLKVFANHAGIALENSRLRTNLENRLEELAQLNKVMKDNQDRLMKTERLAVIGEMAARVAHEVRNPLVSIGGFARLVRRGIDADDPRSDYLRIISDEVARLERIVQELLDYSRPRNLLRLKDVELNELVRELVAMATVEAAEHGIRVEEAFDAAIGVVTIDVDKTRQVLLNIIRNALDVMLGDGSLRVETSLVDDRFRVTIADNGPGIPAEKREKVFEPGFTTRQEGTGFGLAIAKRLVELQGGQITLRDSVPVGCTFDIVIPRRVEARPSAASWSSSPSPGGAA